MKQSIILMALIGSILSACGGSEPSPPTAPEKPQAKATPAVNPAIDYTDPIELKKPTLNIAELVKSSGLREVERVKRDDVVVHLLTLIIGKAPQSRGFVWLGNLNHHLFAKRLERIGNRVNFGCVL